MRQFIKDAREFINREKLYTWLLIFILFVNALVVLGTSKESPKILELKKEEALLKEEYSLTPEKLEVLTKEKKEIIMVLNFLVLLIVLLLVLGLILDVLLLRYKAKQKMLLGFTGGPVLDVSWDIWDVCKAVILFLFFGYVITIVEVALAKKFPSIEEKEHIRMMINSSFLDVFVILFVLHRIVVVYKDKLKTLGLSLIDFFKNVFLGIMGYITALPMIIGTLIFVIWITKLVNYEPPIEPILKLFLEEDNMSFILYSTIFVTIFGPIFEEIFFRGFMYSALKKKIGAIGAIITSSALFSLLHTNIIGFVPIMILGVLLAYLCEKSGSLIPSITVHVIHNTGMMTFVLLLKELR